VAAFARQVGRDDEVSAMEWAGRITNAELRMETMRGMVRDLKRLKPAASHDVALTWCGAGYKPALHRLQWRVASGAESV
jgi:hypothetical protein